MSSAERLAAIARSKKNIKLVVNEVPPEWQIDLAGLKALSDEMKYRIGLNTSARNASVRSAEKAFTGF